MGKIIMIGAMKGGVGKSVTTFNLAYSLQKKGKKVLAVDFDPQSNLTICFGADDVDVAIGDLMLAVIEDEELSDREEYQHGRANTLRQAVRSIRKHDKWQMNGRKW